ncbi:MAG: ATP-binding protein, partial [Nitrososphaerota archaeon]|nr:ATP-binding protein [Nitrososphaerota archaeon]
MDVETAKRAIRDQEEEITTKLRNEKIITREFLKGAREVISSPNALVLKGVRRCGKSVASILLAREGRFAYVNFDDPTLAGIHQSDLRTVVEAIYSLKGDFETLVLDEVQNAAGWELLVSRLRETKKVIVTGSNASLLSREFSTSLTGRYVGFTAFPFSFREHLDMLGSRPDVHLTKDIAQTKNLLEGYIRMGGFAETRKFGERFLLQIYDDIIAKDVERRYNLRFRQTFRDMARYIMSNAAKELTFNKLKNIFGLSSVHTARNYVGYLEDAYLIFSLQRYHPKLKMQMMAPRKAYCIDTGIVNILTSSAGEDRGRLMENLVAVELWRRISYWNPGFTLNYWKNHVG